jgi:hypothetical protein
MLAVTLRRGGRSVGLSGFRYSAFIRSSWPRPESTIILEGTPEQNDSLEGIAPRGPGSVGQRTAGPVSGRSSRSYSAWVMA